MEKSIYSISVIDLLWVALPVFIVLVILQRWHTPLKPTVTGLIRMLCQLFLIGYALNYIFSVQQPILVVAVLVFMLITASVIALRPVQEKSRHMVKHVFIAILTGGLLNLTVVVFGVLHIDPWFSPRFLVPLAGMIFANSMNAVSIGAERFESETASGKNYEECRDISLKAALIPITNSLFAVGLVSLPGMMTGQILSGVPPLIAARYQIMVMCMIFGSTGISAAVYLFLQKDIQCNVKCKSANDKEGESCR